MKTRDNKMIAQMISGILLFICYSLEWTYNGGFSEMYARDYAKMEIWSNWYTTPFPQNLLFLLPIFGVVSIYLSWVKKYSYVYNLAVLIICTPILARTWLTIAGFEFEISLSLGFYSALMGLVACAYSIVVLKRELQGKEKEEVQLVLGKAKEILAELKKLKSDKR